MNTRILRMCHASTALGRRCRVVQDLGQLQPVLFSIENGGVTLRIEGVSMGRPCWWRLPLPECKRQAKRLFAELERAKANGQPSAARLARQAREVSAGAA